MKFHYRQHFILIYTCRFDTAFFRTFNLKIQNHGYTIFRNLKFLYIHMPSVSLRNDEKTET